jgi:hypothetical protein
MHCQPPLSRLPQFTFMTAALCGGILAGALGITGCQTLISTGIEAETQRPVTGVAYSLPTGRVEIEVVKNAVGLEAQAAAVSAQKAAASAKASADAAKQVKAATQGRTPEKPANAPVQGQASAPPSIPATQNPPGSSQAAPAIPDTSGPIAAAASKPAKVSTAWSYKIRYKATRYVPDPHHRFVVSHRPNLFSNDDIRVVVGKDGLLDLVEVTSEDKSVEVVRKLIEIGKNVARIAAQAGGARSTPEEEVIFKASLDPTSDIEVAKINQALRQVEGGPYEVRLTDRSPAGSKQVNSTYAPDGTAGRAFEGIVFRPALAYGLRLSRQSIVQEVATVLLPNEAEILHMPVNRSAFVKKVQKLDFNEGLLVEATLKKPSEALGAVEIPLEISRAILALPGEIVADNVAALKGDQNLSTQAVSTAQAQRRLQRNALEEEVKDRQEELRLLEAEKALRDFDPQN